MSLDESHDCSVGWGNLSAHWFWGKQAWQRNLKQNHCFVGSGSDPSSVIVQENSWSVARTNTSLLNISLWLAELPFSQDWDRVAKKGACAEDNFHNVTILIAERKNWLILWCWGLIQDALQFIFILLFTGAVFLQDFGRVNAKEKACVTTYSKTWQLSHFSVYCFSLMQIK